MVLEEESRLVKRTKNPGIPTEFDYFNLPDWFATGIRSSESKTQHTIDVEARFPKPLLCLSSKVDCSGKIDGASRIATHERPVIHLRDIPWNGGYVGLRVKSTRYWCKTCCRTWMADLTPNKHPNYDMTARLVDFIGKQSVQYTFLEVSRQAGVSEASVRAIFKDFAADKVPSLTSKITAPYSLGVDDKFYGKKPNRDGSKKKMSVFVDLVDGTLIEVVEGANKDVMRSVRDRFENFMNTKVICHDMALHYSGLTEGKKTNAIRIIDKYHVVAALNNALTMARNSLKGKILDEDSKELTKKRKFLAKIGKYEDQRDNELRATILQKHAQLKLVYELRDKFFKFYSHTTRVAAESYYNESTSQITDDVKPYFKNILNHMDPNLSSREPILNWFEYSSQNYTNGIVENLNGRIQRTIHAGNGYTFNVLRKKLLLKFGKDAPKTEKYCRAKREPNKPQTPIAGKQKRSRQLDAAMLKPEEINESDVAPPMASAPRAIPVQLRLDDAFGGTIFTVLPENELKNGGSSHVKPRRRKRAKPVKGAEKGSDQ